MGNTIFDLCTTDTHDTHDTYGTHDIHDTLGTHSAVWFVVAPGLHVIFPGFSLVVERKQK